MALTQQIEVNWQCGECGEIFNVENHLKEHIDVTHVEDNQRQNNECKTCSDKDKQISEANNRETASKNIEKELELLRRRHDALKEKHEEANKKNKEYSKNIFSYIKENTELKNDAVKDAETLADTLSINQVLVEEIKVKDQIIRANEILN